MEKDIKVTEADRKAAKSWLEDNPAPILEIVIAKFMQSERESAQKDYDGMREFQRKFINSDHLARLLHEALKECDPCEHCPVMCKENCNLFKQRKTAMDAAKEAGL